MTATTSGAAAALNALVERLGPVRAWWRARARREQHLVIGAAVLVGVLLLWLVAIRPAWTSLRQTPAQLDALDLQLQAMQRLAAEARELRAAPAVPSSQSSAALQSATERLGDRARLTVQGDHAVLSVTGIDGTSLRSWLAETRSGARARPVEAQLARGPNGFTGTITVSLPGTP